MKNLTFLFCGFLGLTLFGQTSFSNEFNKAADHVANTEFKKAINAFTRALREKGTAKSNYEVADAFIYRGYCYSELKDYESALSDIDKALDLKPEYQKAHSMKSGVLLKAGRPKECVDAANKGLSYNPSNDDLILRKATALVQLREYDQAINTAKGGLENDPKNVPLLDAIGSAHVKAKAWDSAVYAFNKVIEVNPLEPAAYFNRGISYSYLGDYKRAEDDIQQAMRLDTASKFVGYNNLGFFLRLEQKQFKEAISYFDKAIEAKPDFAFAYSNRAFAKINMGDKKGAFDDIKKSIELDPSNSYAYKNLGIIYLKTGDSKNACLNFQKSLNLNYALDYDDEVDILMKNNCTK